MGRDIQQNWVAQVYKILCDVFLLMSAYPQKPENESKGECGAAAACEKEPTLGQCEVLKAVQEKQ